MKTLGIDSSNSSLVYEGASNWGYPIWPGPTLLAVTIVDESSNDITLDNRQRDVSTLDYVLVDLGYDPNSRVRKGRLFKRSEGTQPALWHVQPHPAFPIERTRIDSNGVLDKSLATYCGFSLPQELKSKAIQRPFFILGNELSFTLWSLVDIESTVSGEPLVYLKSRKVFGALPDLNQNAVPSAHYERIVEKLEILSEDLYRAGPESVIDRCREAATAILSGYLQDAGVSQSGKDLGVLANAYDNHNQQNQVIAGQARAIARLHGRGKNSEQEKRSVRPPTETDAEFAVQAVGLIVRELGWAK
ncbi:MAG: hypothetical protein ABW101_02325 [Candidatus Thiodiazotropha sp.]